jgi:O-methyltransferase
MANLILKLGKRCVNILLKRYNQIACSVMAALDKERQSFVFEYEYIRASSLELVANEIYDKNISGSVAELGVYRGDFARLINIAFPDRKLYLLDTFEGFDERDVKTEITNSFSTGTQDFSKTSVELVLNKMKHKENCVIKKVIFLNQLMVGGG